ncbi:MAG: glutathione peroxidase [Lunatimonas sp.]|nr:glutathione peroxidase [Lunatimonas sp.]
MIFWKRHRVWAGLALAAFFVLIFPGNIAQYINGTDAFGLNTDQARLIRLFFQPTLVLWALWSTGALKVLFDRSRNSQELNGTRFYDLEATDIQGFSVKMDQYKGKVVLIVNTATKCGLAPQFDGLEKLHQAYQTSGLVVLGFPSNQFANQEPGTDKNISETCSVNFGVTFRLMSKVQVNGKNTHPVFVYLKQSLGGLFTDDIKWNFTKFLIDRQGNPVKRFAPTTSPEQIEAFIKDLL